MTTCCMARITANRLKVYEWNVNTSGEPVRKAREHMFFETVCVFKNVSECILVCNARERRCTQRKLALS